MDRKYAPGAERRGGRMRQAVVDWGRVLDTAIGLGLAKERIARITAISSYCLDGMRYGQADPWYSAGESLLLLADEQAPWCPLIDWRRVVLDLYAFGLQRWAVADRVDISPYRLDYVELGNEPRHGPGRKLLQLHAFVTSWRGFDAA